MVSALLVDLDGTLANSIPVLKDVFFTFLQAHGVAAVEQDFLAQAGPSLREVVANLKRKYGWQASVEELYGAYAQRLVDKYAHIGLVEGAKEALTLAKERGCRLALVTAADEKFARSFLRAHTIEAPFDVLVCAQQYEPGKPHPALYLRALKALQLPPAEAVAVEDSTAGVQAALAAGCCVFWLTTPHSQSEEGRVIRISGWKEVSKWLLLQ